MDTSSYTPIKQTPRGGPCLSLLPLFDSIRRTSLSLDGHFVLQPVSCKSTWYTVPYFGINGLSMILCLWSPLHPLSKLLAIQDHAQILEQQLWMGGRWEVSIISHRPVLRSDLKQERLVFRECLNIFATNCSPKGIHLRESWLYNYYCHLFLHFSTL